MDWYSRKVLGWAVSNTMETGLCLEALDKALTNTGAVPEIFNTDQGCQFTSVEWTGRLKDLGIHLSNKGTPATAPPDPQKLLISECQLSNGQVSQAVPTRVNGNSPPGQPVLGKRMVPSNPGATHPVAPETGRPAWFAKPGRASCQSE